MLYKVVLTFECVDEITDSLWGEITMDIWSHFRVMLHYGGPYVDYGILQAVDNK